ncbi:MAG: hypothetical protein MI867_24690 [Pseudomonadales bacterium]|nr:hypothetical protein [Pseudomonadales bacterium]
MNDIVITVLSSVGGSAIIIGGLSNWLGKVWANRILEQDKKRYQEEIELLKKQYEVHFDGLKAVLMRYSERQFDIYRELWGSLCELKLTTDDLWIRATPDNVARFSEQLNKTRFWLEKSSLFIEDTHYQRLKGVFDEFEQFLVGKENLVELRNDPSISKEELHYRTRDVVESNRWHREHFTDTLAELRGYFKKHIAGTEEAS